MYTQYQYPNFDVNSKMNSNSIVSKQGNISRGIGFTTNAVTSKTLDAENEMELSYSTSFPWKLYQLLSVEENQSAVNWLSHGKAFRVENPQRFSNEIVPHYFKHKKISSFQRQLNLYGFRRIVKGEEQGAYFHPLFQKDRKDLLVSIKRVSTKHSYDNAFQSSTTYANYPNTQPVIQTTAHIVTPSGQNFQSQSYDKQVNHGCASLRPIKTQSGISHNKNGQKSADFWDVNDHVQYDQNENERVAMKAGNNSNTQPRNTSIYSNVSHHSGYSTAVTGAGAVYTSQINALYDSFYPWTQNNQQSTNNETNKTNNNNNNNNNNTEVKAVKTQAFTSSMYILPKGNTANAVSANTTTTTQNHSMNQQNNNVNINANTGTKRNTTTANIGFIAEPKPVTGMSKLSQRIGYDRILASNCNDHMLKSYTTQLRGIAVNELTSNNNGYDYQTKRPRLEQMNTSQSALATTGGVSLIQSNMLVRMTSCNSLTGLSQSPSCADISLMRFDSLTDNYDFGLCSNASSGNLTAMLAANSLINNSNHSSDITNNTTNNNNNSNSNQIFGSSSKSTDSESNSTNTTSNNTNGSYKLTNTNVNTTVNTSGTNIKHLGDSSVTLPTVSGSAQIGLRSLALTNNKSYIASNKTSNESLDKLMVNATRDTTLLDTLTDEEDIEFLRLMGHTQ